jgi:hypothetical protein
MLKFKYILFFNFLSTLNFTVSGQETSNLTLFFRFTVLLINLIFIFRNYNFLKFESNFSRFCLFLIAFPIILSISSINPADSALKSFEYLATFLALYSAINKYGTIAIDHFIQLFFYWGCYLFFIYIFFPSISRIETGGLIPMAYSYFPSLNPNALGAVGIYILIGFNTQKYIKSKFKKFVGLTLLIISNSRAAFLFYILYLFKEKKKSFYLIIPIVIVILFFSSDLLFTYLLRGGKIEDLYELSSRIYIWTEYINMVNFEEIISTGYGPFQGSKALSFFYSNQMFSENQSIENSLFELILGNGIIYSSLWLIMIIVSFFKILKNNPNYIFLFTYILMKGILSSNIIFHSNILFISILSISILNIIPKNAHKKI